MLDQLDGTEIAIIGMAGRFPKAATIDQFWRNLCDGVEGIRFFSAPELEAEGVPAFLLDDPSYVRAAATIDDAEAFDAAFFGCTPREAELMDPQHRVLLETAWQALEHAGYDAANYKGAIGVFAGATINTYLLLNILSNPEVINGLEDVQINIANGSDFLTTRISYKLNLRGPSHVVQSACSTSLVAVHLACQSLLDNESDMALAGGVSINGKLRGGYRYVDGGMASPDGHCRAFDAHAQGTIFGSGVGLVVLKRIEDAIADGDTIHALIKGSAINNDGSLKVGYTAPSVDGQAEVITEALASAGVEPVTIGYIEAHGTGTPLGDPIEVQALTRAFAARTSAKGWCGIGSVKSNIGHLDAAAGVTGLIKAALALKHKQLPPSLHFKQPNAQIDFNNSPFYVVSRLKEWEAGRTPRRAGVSAFGVGGTNAHVVLQEAPPAPAAAVSRPWQLLTLSAKTASALETATANLAAHVRLHAEVNFPDLAYTLKVGRHPFNHRRAVICRDRGEAAAALEGLAAERVFTGEARDGARPVVFLFPGQGSQFVNMGRELYEQEPAFRGAVDHCAMLLKPDLGRDLRDFLYPHRHAEAHAAEQLCQTNITQPVLFTVEYALARMWMGWGVQPAAMIGHSLGEYVAACLAGVMGLEDALMIVAGRAQLMQRLPAGAMTSVGLSREEVEPFLGDRLSLAAVNGRTQCVVSGAPDAIVEFERGLDRDGVFFRRLPGSHAFHSMMMEPMMDSLHRLVSRVKLRPPAIPYISNVTGTWITPEEATAPDYWRLHLRRAVQFAEGMNELLKQPRRILLEVGPGETLSRLARRQAANSGADAFATLGQSGENKSAAEYVLTTLGKLWLAGAEADWVSYYSGERRQRVPLPTYPFERRRYWIEPRRERAPAARPAAGGSLDTREGRPASDTPPEPQVPPSTSSPSLHPRPRLDNPYVGPTGELEQAIAAVWQNVLGIEEIGVQDNFFDLGGDSLLAIQVIAQLKNELGIELPAVSLYEGVTIKSLVDILNAGPASQNEIADGDEHEQRLARRKNHQQQQRSRRREAAR